MAKKEDARTHEDLKNRVKEILEEIGKDLGESTTLKINIWRSFGSTVSEAIRCYLELSRIYMLGNYQESRKHLLGKILDEKEGLVTKAKNDELHRRGINIFLKKIWSKIDVEEIENFDFSGLNLNNFDFSKVKSLSNCTFAGANLNRSNFSGVRLISVNFAKANLNGADFSNSQLEGVNFDGANIMYIQGIDGNGSIKGNDSFKKAVEIHEKKVHGLSQMSSIESSIGKDVEEINRLRNIVNK
ncbi:pentapeptide repeat-containing protein [Rothia sp. CCM 9418]|uniref:pentapeptide repeat-containing protein n=1 Tax=Rothia sp. CCM 9418 TaxID=3402661 RepID=UPI003AD936A3